MGHLTRDEDPAGGFKELVRRRIDNGFEVRLITRLLRETRYRVEPQPTGEMLLENACCGGKKIVVRTGTDGTSTITHPDGTEVKVAYVPDPRWGMQAPIVAARTTTTPDGLSTTIADELTVELMNPGDPLSLQRLTETVTINGQSNIETFEVPSLKLSSRTPSGRVSTTTFDAQGNVIETQVPGLLPIKCAYNARGQLETIIQGANSSIFRYDPQGNLASITDALSRSTHFERDALGRLIKRILPDNREVAFTYDENSNLTSLLLPGRPPHEFTYTAMDLEEHYIPPDVGIGSNPIRSDYNADQQLERLTLSDGQTISYDYDDAGRLRFVTMPRGRMELTYDVTTGNLIRLAAPDGGTVTYEYDGSLRTSISWSGPISGSLLTTYNNDFLLSSQRANDEQLIDFGYDVDELLTQAGALSLIRDPQNGMLTETRLDNVTGSRTYDAFGEFESYNVAANGMDLFAVQYTRDLLLRIIQKVETINGETHSFEYAYDNAGNLREVRQDGNVVSQFSYDENGNRLSHIHPNGTDSGAYDDQDRLLTYGNKKYFYTVNGELLSKTDTADNVTTNYGYDVLGNLMTVSLPNGNQIEYLIDGEGRRIGKRINGVLVQGFLYQDSLNPLAELDSNNNVISRFVYASSENVPDYMVKGNATFRIIVDHVGSVRLVVDAQTGQIAQRLGYDVFGNVIEDTNPGFQPFGFAGGLYDADTGLIRFGARDYDPEVGRWTAKDPILFAGGHPNLYAYVGNDPVNFVDPSGLFVNLLLGCASSVIAGGILSKVTGACHDFGDAIIDCAMGAAGVGVFNKLRKLSRVSRLRKIARQHGLSRVVQPKIGVEKYVGSHGAEIEIKHARNIFNPGKGTLNPEGSWVHRAKVVAAHGNPKGVRRQFVDPFTGGVGTTRSSAAHIPLEANTGEALNLGLVIGGGRAAGRPDCGCE